MNRFAILANVEAPAPYAELAALVAILSDILAALAVVVGGVWVYFKFARGRTFKPRMATALTGQWIAGSDYPHQLLLVRLGLKNIGASKIGILQEGTGLQVWIHTDKIGSGEESALKEAETRFGEIPERGTALWSQYERKFSIFDKHDWIEPGEQISDDRLVRFPEEVRGGVVLLRARVVCKRRLRANIVIFARTVVWKDSRVGEVGGLDSAASKREG